MVRAPAIVVFALLFSPLVVAPDVAATHAYELGVLMQWDTTTIDVVVLGDTSPVVGQAIRDGIGVWQAIIAAQAPDWLRDGVTFRVYAPATDASPPAGFEAHDVEIIVVPQGFFAVTSGSGTGWQARCVATAPLAYEALFGPHSMYRVVAHEFGHCLGLGHVFAHGVEYEPSFDIMGGGRGPACPSNLDMQVLERAFGGLFGQTAGGIVTMPSAAYAQYPCDHGPTPA